MAEYVQVKKMPPSKKSDKGKTSLKRRLSLVTKLRSLTGSTSKLPSSHSTNTGFQQQPTPSPPSTVTSAPCSPTAQFSTTAISTWTTTPPSTNSASRPQRHASPSSLYGSHFFSTAFPADNARQQSLSWGCLCSDPIVAGDTITASVSQDKVGDGWQATAGGARKRLSGQNKEEVQGGDLVVHRRTCSGSDLISSSTTSTPTKGRVSFSYGPVASREKLVSKQGSSSSGKLEGVREASGPVGIPQMVGIPGKNDSSGEKCHNADAGLSQDGGGSVKVKRNKSVCVVAPSDAKLRRTNSEKVKTGSGSKGTILKTAALSRRSTLSTYSRRSVTGTVSFDQVSCRDTEHGTDTSETLLKEHHRSGSYGHAASCSGDSAALQNGATASIPMPALDRKVGEPNELPSYVSKSKNAKFHKLFKNVPADEYPIDTYSCAFKGDILLQGMMYVSHNWICFHSKIRARGRLLELPLEKVISITREKLALIIPNAIGIQVADQKYVFGSFLSRDNTYKLLVTLLKHSQDSTDSTNTKENELSCCEHFTDSTNTKENDELSCCENSAIKGQQSVSCKSLEVTNSADVSEESDMSSESEAQEENQLEDSVQSSPSSVSTAGAEIQRVDPQPDNAPGSQFLRCVDIRKIFAAFSKCTFKLQKVPRTNLFLAVCIVLVMFLILSAVALAYKIILLQTHLEMSHMWPPAKHRIMRDQMQGSLYTLHSRHHISAVHHLHEVLKANLQLLEQVHQSLKGLQSCTPKVSPPAK